MNILNLVKGQEVLVESPSESFNPYVVHYAETFIVPASARNFSIQGWFSLLFWRLSFTLHSCGFYFIKNWLQKRDSAWSLYHGCGMSFILSCGVL